MLETMKNLIFSKRNYCSICGENKVDRPNQICKSCREFIEISNRELNLKLPHIEKSYSSCTYNRIMRKQLHEFKFSGKSYLYKGFGEILIYTIEEMGLIDTIDAITFVPMHNKRKAERGYNQSELLAKYVAENLEIPLLKKHLIKTKWTVEQNKLGKTERMTNLNKSFKAMNIEDIKDKEILLIDDIITTGATMEECGKTLVEAGAKTIYGLALTSSRKL